MTCGGTGVAKPFHIGAAGPAEVDSLGRRRSHTPCRDCNPVAIYFQLCSRDELSLRCTRSCVIVINYEPTTHHAKRVMTNSLSVKVLTPSTSPGSPNTPSPAAFLWAPSEMLRWPSAAAKPVHCFTIIHSVEANVAWWIS